jgi:RNA polymerase sporulation-specific sigma factor
MSAQTPGRDDEARKEVISPMGVLGRDQGGVFAFSDEDLARQARAGSSRAAERLLAKYRPLVESKARSYFLLGADHDDVVQEGMIGLYKAIRDYREDRLAHFRAFADMCVTRQIISAVKNATRQKHLPLNAYVSFHTVATADQEAENALLDYLPDPRLTDPQQRLFYRRDEAARLEAVRRTLSPLETRVLEGYLAGMSYREMSRELRCPQKRVDNALQRIRRKLGETRPPE